MKLQGKRGTILLEFAMSAIVLIILFAGMANCALVLGERIIMESAIREAGREAAVSESLSKGRNVGENVLTSAGINPGRYELSVYQAGDRLIAVDATVNSPVLLPLIGGLAGGNWSSFIPLSDTKYFRLENTPKS
ncbi:MAG: pilus assembly protein [Firmicutes bacterium]|nr:pilus assembly protein [Bacillota bacterium]